MFDVGWSEIMIIGGVALVVIGPKDLPYVVRSVAGFVRKARNVASEFQSSLTDIADQADLKELRKQLVRETDDFKETMNMEGEKQLLNDATNSLSEAIEKSIAQTAEEIPKIESVATDEFEESPIKARKPRAKKIKSEDV